MVFCDPDVKLFSQLFEWLLENTAYWKEIMKLLFHDHKETKYIYKK